MADGAPLPKNRSIVDSRWPMARRCQQRGRHPAHHPPSTINHRLLQFGTPSTIHHQPSTPSVRHTIHHPPSTIDSFSSAHHPPSTINHRLLQFRTIHARPSTINHLKQIN